MNIREAKKIPIVSFLAAMGHNPVDSTADDLWYLSPFRSESSASFKVNVARNIWFDHGAGAGGTIIDLAEQLCRVDASGALSVLGGQCWPAVDPLSFSFHPPLSEADHERRVVVRSIKLLNNPALIRYTESRRIPLEYARAYLSECYYTVAGKPYFGLAFANDGGGYEIRNKLWQGASSPKGITTLPVSGSSVLCLFEGFFDFLSALVYYQRPKPDCTMIVLNSLSFVGDVLPLLNQYQRVNLFLDNDDAGRKASSLIAGQHPHVQDYAGRVYPSHKDFNDLINHG